MALALQVDEEQHLVARCHQGDDEAFAELYRRYLPTAVRFAHRVMRDPYLAEDIAQQAFLKAFRSIHHFRHHSSFRTWLYRLTVNEAISFLRRRSSAEPPLPYGDMAADRTLASPEETLKISDLQGTVRRAIAELHSPLRVVVAYKYYHDLTEAEIAQRLGCPVGTVKSRLHRARNKLRAILPSDVRTL